MLPFRVPLLRRIARAVAEFSPAELFAAGAVGAWYDPSSLWGAADHLPRRNILLATATLATQTRTVTAVSHTLYIKGTGSVTLSGAATGTLSGTGANNRVSLVFTPTAGNLTLTVSGTVTEGHLTTTATLDHSYQAITDWTTELYAHAASKNVPWLRRNFFRSSEDLSNNTIWQRTSCTAAYDGTFTTITGTGAWIIADYFIPHTIGTTYTVTSIVKTSSGTATFRLYGNSGQISGNFTATTEEQSFSYTYTAVLAGNQQVGFTRGSSNNNATILVKNAHVQVGGSATFQAVPGSWEAAYAANAAAAGVPLTMYQDSAGTTPVTGPDSVIGKLNDLSGNGNHALQSGATGLKPTLRLNSNGYWWIQRDLSDDALVTTFPNLGANCVSYINDGSTVTETTGVTLNGALTQSTPAADYGRIYLNAPSSKSAQIINWLKAKAGLL